MNPVHCIAAVFLIAGGIVCFTGCDSKVVDVDELTCGKSLTGTVVSSNSMERSIRQWK